MSKRANGAKPFVALPAYFGGKRNLVNSIFGRLAEVIPRPEWAERTFLDVFAGGCSISLYAKMQGFKAVLSNDWSQRSQIILQALLMNNTQTLSREDLLILSQPLPEGETSFIQKQFASHVFSSRHAQALDRIRYWASRYQNPVKRNLALLLLWHLVYEHVCMPTSVNTSNRPYAETLDGLRDWQDINPKRFIDNSFPRLLKPSLSGLERLRGRINAGVTGGSPVIAYQQDACDFLQSVKGDIAYFDPPYPGTLSYESSLKTLDAILLGQISEPLNPVSPFTKDIQALKPLLESARHIPVWILSYGNNCIDLDGLVQQVQDLAPGRTVLGFQRAYRHLAHVSKSLDRKELLIVAYE